MIKRRILSGINTCKEVFIKALLSGSSPERLSWSFCLGLYIAFSPFPGMHSVMMLGSMCIWNLHFPTLFIATSLNNPWTMIPFFSFDYAFGYWFLHSMLGINPSWTLSLAKIFGSGKICVWSFLIGGNVLGVASALLCYPVVKKIFGNLAKTLSPEHTIEKYENHSNQ